MPSLDLDYKKLAEELRHQTAPTAETPEKLELPKVDRETASSASTSAKEGFDAQAVARKLYEAGPNKFGTDEKTIIDSLRALNGEQLAAVRKAWEVPIDKGGFNPNAGMISFDQAMTNEFEGDRTDAKGDYLETGEQEYQAVTELLAKKSGESATQVAEAGKGTEQAAEKTPEEVAKAKSDHWSNPQFARESYEAVKSGQSLLKSGHHGQAVKDAAQYLNELGYDVGKTAETGRYTNDFKQVVIDFQKKAGIGIDGIIGPETSGAFAQAIAAKQEKVQQQQVAEAKAAEETVQNSKLAADQQGSRAAAAEHYKVTEDQLVDKLAKEVHASTSGRMGTSETRLLEALRYAHDGGMVGNVAEKYQAEYGKPMADVILNEVQSKGFGREASPSEIAQYHALLGKEAVSSEAFAQIRDTYGPYSQRVTSDAFAVAHALNRGNADEVIRALNNSYNSKAAWDTMIAMDQSGNFGGMFGFKKVDGEEVPRNAREIFDKTFGFKYENKANPEVATEIKHKEEYAALRKLIGLPEMKLAAKQ